MKVTWPYIQVDVGKSSHACESYRLAPHSPSPPLPISDPNVNPAAIRHRSAVQNLSWSDLNKRIKWTERCFFILILSVTFAVSYLQISLIQLLVLESDADTLNWIRSLPTTTTAKEPDQQQKSYKLTEIV